MIPYGYTWRDGMLFSIKYVHRLKWILSVTDVELLWYHVYDFISGKSGVDDVYRRNHAVVSGSAAADPVSRGG